MKKVLLGVSSICLLVCSANVTGYAQKKATASTANTKPAAPTQDKLPAYIDKTFFDTTAKPQQVFSNSIY